MTDDIRKAIEEMEALDETLRGLGACVEVMALGASAMANGDVIADLMNHIRNTLRDVRAGLDEATTLIMRIQRAA